MTFSVDHKGTGDIPMESLTNPPTPGSSGGQMEAESNLHKAESTTMICEPSDNEVTTTSTNETSRTEQPTVPTTLSLVESSGVSSLNGTSNATVPTKGMSDIMGH